VLDRLFHVPGGPGRPPGPHRRRGGPGRDAPGAAVGSVDVERGAAGRGVRLPGAERHDLPIEFAFPMLRWLPMITDAGLNLLAQALRDGTSIEIKYIALGAGNTPPSPSDTKLEDERFRKPVSRQLPLGTGGTQTIAYIAPHEANDFVIAEIGVFAGDDAT